MLNLEKTSISISESSKKKDDISEKFKITPATTTGRAKRNDNTIKTTVKGVETNKSKKKKAYTLEALQYEIQTKQKDLFIFENKVYDATKFKTIHPGGYKPIERMVGQDATDEIRGFHPKSVIDEKFKYFYVGEFLDVDNSMASNSALAKKYRTLNEELRSKGFYEYDYMFYIRRFIFFACLWMVSVSILQRNPESVKHICLSAFLMGMLWHGLSFSSHDLGHNCVTGIRKIDYSIAIFYASFIGGLSISWWKDSHNVHHIVTNHPEHDPDIQHFPFLAVTTQLCKSLYSTYHKKVMKYDWVAKMLVSFQHYSFLPILSFGRFNLQAQSLLFLLNFKERRERRFIELFGMGFFFYWFGYWLICSHISSLPLRVLYLYTAYASTTLLHLQITLSHFAMSTDTIPNELFLLKGLRTTMNVDCPAYLDWVHGGLQFQVEHHLFPRMPRVHLRKVMPLVKQFCEENGLDYYSYGFFSGNSLVFGVLKDVADQVKLICTSANPQKRYKNL